MNLNCAILHADPEIAGRLEEYIDKVPFLSLHGKYGNPLEALKDYYETKVEVILSASIRWKKVKSTEWIFAGSCPRPLVSFSLQIPTSMLPSVSAWMRWTI